MKCAVCGEAGSSFSGYITRPSALSSSVMPVSFRKRNGSFLLTNKVAAGAGDTKGRIPVFMIVFPNRSRRPENPGLSSQRYTV
jgi:hypothetical protein